MNIIRKFIPGANEMPVTGGDAFRADKVRRVALRCSSGRQDRDGEIVVQEGISLENFRRNPVGLFNHSLSSPIARAVNIGISAGCLECEIEFPPPGTSALSDQIYGLIRADIIKGVSIGFQPVESQPLDKGNPVKGPQRYTRSELWEISICTVPSNPDGCVTWKFAQGDQRARHKFEVDALRKAGREAERRRRQVEVARLGVVR